MGRCARTSAAGRGCAHAVQASTCAAAYQCGSCTQALHLASHLHSSRFLMANDSLQRRGEEAGGSRSTERRGRRRQRLRAAGNGARRSGRRTDRHGTWIASTGRRARPGRAPGRARQPPRRPQRRGTPDRAPAAPPVDRARRPHERLPLQVREVHFGRLWLPSERSSLFQGLG